MIEDILKDHHLERGTRGMATRCICGVHLTEPEEMDAHRSVVLVAAGYGEGISMELAETAMLAVVEVSVDAAIQEERATFRKVLNRHISATEEVGREQTDALVRKVAESRAMGLQLVLDEVEKWD